MRGLEFVRVHAATRRGSGQDLLGSYPRPKKTRHESVLDLLPCRAKIWRESFQLSQVALPEFGSLLHSGSLSRFGSLTGGGSLLSLGSLAHCGSLAGCGSLAVGGSL